MVEGICNCPICKTNATTEDVQGRDAIKFNCPRCGPYSASGTAFSMLSHHEFTPRQTANASGWIHVHQNIELSSGDIDFLASLRTPTVGERAAKLLLEIGRRFPDVGTAINFNFADPSSIGDWLASTWSNNVSEVQYLAIDYLQSQQLIDGKIFRTNSGAMLSGASITPQGHQQLEKMRLDGSESAMGFCAMWFSPKLLPVWTDGIEPAIRDAGYDPQRIDRLQHNNKIDDEIVAMIRRSRFVVADFTGNRGGVYFEAGFAMGRAIPVVWTIRSGRFHRVHFDNRQYNFVDWSFDELPDFKVRLQNRIEATLGRGPIRKVP